MPVIEPPTATDTPPDGKIALLKGILVNIGGVVSDADAPDTAIQILQAIVQVYGFTTEELADTQTSLLLQWIEGLGFAYDGALQTEVECLKVIYIFFGGADDATLPDHEIPLLKGIYGSAFPPVSVWILDTGFWNDLGRWFDTSVWID